MDQLSGFRVADKLYKKSLLNAIACAAALSIFFFGKHFPMNYLAILALTR